MRLVRPSAGECADRLAILELKIEFGKKRGIDVAHFEEELREINEYLGAIKASWNIEDYLQLRKVNRELWDLEGWVRNGRDWIADPWLAVAGLKNITLANDKRAALVNKIDGTMAKEKLY